MLSVDSGEKCFQKFNNHHFNSHPGERNPLKRILLYKFNIFKSLKFFELLFISFFRLLHSFMRLPRRKVNDLNLVEIKFV